MRSARIEFVRDVQPIEERYLNASDRSVTEVGIRSAAVATPLQIHVLDLAQREVAGESPFAPGPARTTASTGTS